MKREEKNNLNRTYKPLTVSTNLQLHCNAVSTIVGKGIQMGQVWDFSKQPF